jgi:hypothetical protein
MALTGEAKREYQRAYMQQRRGNAGSNTVSLDVRRDGVTELEPVRPVPAGYRSWEDYRSCQHSWLHSRQASRLLKGSHHETRI